MRRRGKSRRYMNESIKIYRKPFVSKYIYPVYDFKKIKMPFVHVTWLPKVSRTHKCFYQK